jgi:AraC-like DNA-binding protein
VLKGIRMETTQLDPLPNAAPTEPPPLMPLLDALPSDDAPAPALPIGVEFVDRVRAAVEQSLAAGTVAITDVSRALETSPRTLQRRLGEHGISFRVVVEAVREQQARAYLSTHELSLAAIADRLGYAEVSAFLRAFKRWTGTTPGRLRAATAA